MPTEKKRVNLSIPDTVYDRLLVYKQKNGITSDAGACLQLIIRQLEAIENTEKMLEAASKFSLEELQQIANVGLPTVKQFIDKQVGGKEV